MENTATKKDQQLSEEREKQVEIDSELDAVHPRFMEPQDPDVLRDYEVRNHYYCQHCRLFFAPTLQGLKTHFRGDMVQHPAFASCFYCQGNVFVYVANNTHHMYHYCSDYKSKTQAEVHKKSNQEHNTSNEQDEEQND